MSQPLRVCLLQCLPLLLEPGRKALWSISQFNIEVCYRDKSNALNFANIRLDNPDHLAKEYMAQLIFRASITEFRLIAKVINELDLGGDIEFITQAALRRDRQ